MKIINATVTDGKVLTSIRNENGWCELDSKCGEFIRALENLVSQELKGNDKVQIDFSMVINGKSYEETFEEYCKRKNNSGSIYGTDTTYNKEDIS